MWENWQGEDAPPFEKGSGPHGPFEVQLSKTGQRELRSTPSGRIYLLCTGVTQADVGTLEG